MHARRQRRARQKRLGSASLFAFLPFALQPPGLPPSVHHASRLPRQPEPEDPEKVLQWPAIISYSARVCEQLLVSGHNSPFSTVGDCDRCPKRGSEAFARLSPNGCERGDRRGWRRGSSRRGSFAVPNKTQNWNCIHANRQEEAKTRLAWTGPTFQPPRSLRLSISVST